MADKELVNLKNKIGEVRHAKTREGAAAQTLEGKQVVVYTVGPRAPASEILGLIEPQLALKPIVRADADPSDDIIIYDRGPNDSVIIISP